MATFQEPIHGLSLSDALKEAAAISPINRAVLYAYELYHPSMTAPVRVVRNHEPIDAGIEYTAPRNPGEMVHFMASAIRVSRPSEGDQSDAPQINISIDNVSSVLTEALRVARSTTEFALQQWELIERVYVSDDLSEPDIQPPMKITLTSVAYNATTATLTASFGDPVNVSIPVITFKPEEYPGLAAI